MTEFSLSSKATCLMILHAAKYPHCCVSGILLGKKDKNDQVVNVVTVIPLFHRWHQLSAMAEVALMQINMMINESQQQIVGYYQANELLNDDS
ncbi:hypothetical protein D917_09673 [Trichinella nativa]|nr:neighbor of COX4 [Trichinella spiralis]OUC43591.1 hypothetical protein D917_09673 [Trichinella nativa]